MSEVLDVVIFGGGLVGGLTALLLAQGGVQPTVLDAAPVLDVEKTLSVMNPRVLALSQATIHLLKTVNVWDDLARQMPYTGMQVWNLNGYGEINFGHESVQRPMPEQSLGYPIALRIDQPQWFPYFAQTSPYSCEYSLSIKPICIEIGL